MPRAFDYSAFCTLGIANDSRGGDSCGVFIDGKYEYGVDKERLFSSYFLASDLLYNMDRASIALLHCRKASVGKVSIETAQPVIINDDYGNVAYVLMHNGTIYNYKELAEKYIPEVDITGMTDSQVMAHIFYNTGYESLNEYNGGAVFAIVDYRGYSPKVMLFKGASRKTEFSKEVEEERPLFYCIDKLKRELVFSSIGIHLLALRKECDTFSLKENTLFEFNGKGLSVVRYYSREKAFQQRACVYTKRESYKGGVLPIIGEPARQEFVSIDHTKNLYTFRGKPVHGKVFLSNYGRIDNHAKKNPKNYEMYFFDGVALKNSYCFRFLTALRKDSRLSDADFFTRFEPVIRYLSVDEIYKCGDKWHKCISPTGSILFTGSLQLLCGITVRNYVAGVHVTTTYNGTYELLEKTVSKKYDINFKSIKEECKSLMK